MSGRKICLLLMVSLFLSACQGNQSEEKKTSIRIGISLYRGDDTFINNIRSESICRRNKKLKSNMCRRS